MTQPAAFAPEECLRHRQGTDERLTMHRLNRVMVENLSTGGQISVEVSTQAEVATGSEPPVPLDLSWKAGRVLIERAAEVRERAAGTPVLRACLRTGLA
jgi:hypothetical protein